MSNPLVNGSPARRERPVDNPSMIVGLAVLGVAIFLLALTFVDVFLICTERTTISAWLRYVGLSLPATGVLCYALGTVLGFAAGLLIGHLWWQ